MCMTLNSHLTVEDFFEGKEEIVCYKIVRKDRSSPFYGLGPRRAYYYKDEVVISNRHDAFTTAYERYDNAVIGGLHLCPNREEAVNSLTYIHEVYGIKGEVVSVSVKREHFVAAGWWTERPELSCIVATQCTVLE